MELIKITAEYSNAVVSVFLPLVSNLVETLEFKVETPIKPEMILGTSIGDNRNDPTVFLKFKSEESFDFRLGYFRKIKSKEACRPVFGFRVKSTNPPVEINQSNVVARAYQVLGKLGLSPEEVFADQAPDFKVCFDQQHYSISWKNPFYEDWPSVKMMFLAKNDQLVELEFNNQNIPKIKLPIPGQFETQTIDLGSEKKMPVAEQRRVFTNFLSEIQFFTRALNHPAPQDFSEVEEIIEGTTEWKSHGYLIQMKNRSFFRVLGGTVVSAGIGRSFFGAQGIKLKEFMAPAKLNNKEVVALARRALDKLFLPTAALETYKDPEIIRPYHYHDKIPFYSLKWMNISGGKLNSWVQCEIDAGKGEILYMDVNYSSLEPLEQRRKNYRPGIRF